MGIEHKWARQLAACGLAAAALAMASGCALAQKAPLLWFDGQHWHTSTDVQGVAQAAGGVVVMAPVAQAAALQAALVALGLNPRPLAVAGAYEVASPAGADALLLTHRLAELPQTLQAPVTVAPNWRTGLRPR